MGTHNMAKQVGVTPRSYYYNTKQGMRVKWRKKDHKIPFFSFPPLSTSKN